jgi:dipeptidyl aminopeptidase/acylaminoacyl peptidase
MQQKMSSLRLPRKEFLSIPNAAGEMMSASLLYPPNFNRAKKYPVLMRVYGGPNSQEVTRAYPFGGQKSFDLYMASKVPHVGSVVMCRVSLCVCVCVCGVLF